MRQKEQFDNYQTSDEIILERLAEIKTQLDTITKQKGKPNPNKLLTRGEVCLILRITKPTLWDWCRKGLIPSYRIGNQIRFKADEVMQALEKRPSKEVQNG